MVISRICFAKTGQIFTAAVIDSFMSHQGGITTCSEADLNLCSAQQWQPLLWVLYARGQHPRRLYLTGSWREERGYNKPSDWTLGVLENYSPDSCEAAVEKRGKERHRTGAGGASISL